MLLEKRLEVLRRRINRLKYVTRVVYRPHRVLKSLYETISVLDVLKYSKLLCQSYLLSMTDRFHTQFSTFRIEQLKMIDHMIKALAAVECINELIDIQDSPMFFWGYVKTRREIASIGEIVSFIWVYVKSFHESWLINDILRYDMRITKIQKDIKEIHDTLSYIKTTILSLSEMPLAYDVRKILFKKYFLETLNGLDFMVMQDIKVIPEVNITRFDYSRFNECGFDWSHMIINDYLKIVHVRIVTFISSMNIVDNFSYQYTCGSGCEINCQTTCEQQCETACEQGCETGCQITCQTPLEPLWEELD